MNKLEIKERAEEQEITKRIMELENINPYLAYSKDGFLIGVFEAKDEDGWHKGYSPFCWHTLGPLMVKYRVDINRVESIVEIYPESHLDYGLKGCTQVSFSTAKEINKAILECIIKSQEK